MKANYEVSRDLTLDLYINKSNRNICSPHFHQQVELLYVIDGEKEVTINNNTLLLKPNQLAIADSFDIHSYPLSKVDNTIVLILPFKYIADYHNYKRSRFLSTNFLLNEEKCKEIFELLIKLDSIKAYNELILKGIANTILGIILSEIPLKENTNTEDLNLIRQILLYIEENFTEDLTLEKLSKQFGYSKHYFSRIFKTYTHCNFKEYLNHIRLKYALEIMQKDKGRKPIDVAFSSGFTSTQTFYRCFKKVYGKSPNEYLSDITQH